MRIRALSSSDAEGWLQLRMSMWPDADRGQLEEELTRIVGDAHQVAIGAFDGPELVAFVELSLHPHAVGCRTGPRAHSRALHIGTLGEFRYVGTCGCSGFRVSPRARSNHSATKRRLPPVTQ